MKKLYDEMHNLFQVSKTLRFELVPAGKTEDNFRKFILENDKKKAEAYPVVKSYCDEVHKKFIDECLVSIDKTLLIEKLQQYSKTFSEKEINTDALDNLKKDMRKIISEAFTKNKQYKEILGEKILTSYITVLYKDDEEALKQINEFNKFSTYFSGYHQTRANMYKNEDKHSAIAYRLIDENLPIFRNNIKLYDKFAAACSNELQKLQLELKINTDEIFTKIEQYSNCLSQKDIEKYNLAINGKTLDDGTKIQGINEYINLYNQKNKDKTKLIKLKNLYKQILSDRERNSFVIDSIENDVQAIEAVKQLYAGINAIITNADFIERFKSTAKYDFSKIYVNIDSITDFSKLVFDDWSYITNIREYYFDKHYIGKLKAGTEKYNKNKEAELKKEKLISLNFIKENCENPEKISNYFAENIDTYIKNIETAYNECKAVLEKEYNFTEKKLLNDKNSAEKIKQLLDSIKGLQNFVKIIIPKIDAETDADFYNSLSYEVLIDVIPVYNKIRNYFTQKPYSEEKIKINFNCSSLLTGWGQDFSLNSAHLLKYNNQYYLFIVNGKIDLKNTASENSDAVLYEYDFQKPDNKNIPRCFIRSKGENFAPAVLKYNLPVKDILDIYDNDKYTVDYKKIDYADFKHSLTKLIDYFKLGFSKHESYNHFNFRWKDSCEYENIADFYKDAIESCYEIHKKKINFSDIQNLADKGNIFLFKIYSKDFSQNKKYNPNAKDNLHTMYWKALFDEDNLKDVIYKLNGGAEIFFRKKSIEYKETHHKNEKLKNKNPLNPKKESVFEYALIKDKRYALDKFQFHAPITLNFKAQGVNNLNDTVKNSIKAADNIHIIGIDRGERHLLYVTVINLQGEIIDKEQFSLNEIDNGNKVNYHDLLERKEKERDEQRKSWNTIENIKELKEGYMSHVVHKIVQLMLKYNAVIVLEDLNSGFKNSRKKVEKSVYDKFEKMLVNKLEYLVNKEITDKFEQGGLLNAYQLTNHEIKGRQNGIIFYIPAWCTSKIDPVTGFVDFFHIKYETKEKAQDFIKKFKDIRYNEKENYFEFECNYKDFACNKDYGKRENWTICTNGERIKTCRDKNSNSQWVSKTVNLTEEFTKLFKEKGIDINNIKETASAKDDKDFLERFINLFKLTVQLRNSVTGSLEDYILSPVKNFKGGFYDSRKCEYNLPKDADANGAYNIARKGLMLINRIKQAKDEKSKIDFAITNADWLNYVQAQDKA